MRAVKQCSRCGEAKDAGAFYHDTSCPRGLSYWCRACKCEATRAYYAANAESQREGARARRKRGTLHLR